MPAEHFRHMVVALTDLRAWLHPARRAPTWSSCRCTSRWAMASAVSGDVPDVPRAEAGDRHTRNLAALEMLVPAWLAACRAHPWRAWLGPQRPGGLQPEVPAGPPALFLVSRYVALSRKIESHLHDKVGIGAGRVRRICNGVDARDFPRDGRGAAARLAVQRSVAACVRRRRASPGRQGPRRPDPRLCSLVRATPRPRAGPPGDRRRRPAAWPSSPPLIREGASTARSGWPASAADIPEVMRSFDVFVQPSIAEGISNTLLEAMASGLPVIATDVGATPSWSRPGAPACWCARRHRRAAAAMGQLFHASDRRSPWGARGARARPGRVQPRRHGRAYLALYQELVCGVSRAA